MAVNVCPWGTSLAFERALANVQEIGARRKSGNAVVPIQARLLAGGSEIESTGESLMTCLGAISPDPVGQLLGSRFDCFTSAHGIDGLARDNGHGMVELLAVHTRTPGKGQFRTFIAALKTEYQTICVWDISNPLLETALPRYGFQREVAIDSSGETLTGWRWDKIYDRLG